MTHQIFLLDISIIVSLKIFRIFFPMIYIVIQFYLILLSFVKK